MLKHKNSVFDHRLLYEEKATVQNKNIKRCLRLGSSLMCHLVAYKQKSILLLCVSCVHVECKKHVEKKVVPHPPPPPRNRFRWVPACGSNSPIARRDCVVRSKNGGRGGWV